MEEDMGKLNIMEDMAEDRKHYFRQLTSQPTPGVGNLGTLNENEIYDD
mgnify:CR=1 FL=1